MAYTKFIVAQLLAAGALSKIQDKGLWSGHGWSDASSGIKISDGIAVGMTDHAQQRLDSATMRSGDDHSGEDNVKRVERVLTQDQWDYLFPVANKIYTRDAFLKAAGKFAGFCGEEGESDETCKRELAALFANWAQETGMNSPWEASHNNHALWQQGLYFTEEAGCGPGQAGHGGSGCDYYSKAAFAQKAWPTEGDAQYYGRGPFQLSYNSNYGQFSNVWVEDEYDSRLELLKTPEKVASDGYTAFAAALWFYMTPQNPKPSMHDVMTGDWEPNDADTAAHLTAGFGALINIINGGLECRSTTEST